MQLRVLTDDTRNKEHGLESTLAFTQLYQCFCAFPSSKSRQLSLLALRLPGSADRRSPRRFSKAINFPRACWSRVIADTWVVEAIALRGCLLDRSSYLMHKSSVKQVKNQAKQKARPVATNPWIERLARSGYADCATPV